MNRKVLLTACVAAVIVPIGVSRVPVAAQVPLSVNRVNVPTQLPLGVSRVPVAAGSPSCQNAYVFRTDNLDNDFGFCRPAFAVNFNQINLPSLTAFARKTDIRVANAISEYHADVAAISERQIAQNKVDKTPRVAISNLKIECPMTKGAVKYLCEPAQQLTSQKTDSERIAER
jgi:type IV secretory pathway protease TraF